MANDGRWRCNLHCAQNDSNYIQSDWFTSFHECWADKVCSSEPLTDGVSLTTEQWRVHANVKVIWSKKTFVRGDDFFFLKLKIGDKMWQVQKPSLKPFCNNESLPIHLFKKWHQDWLVSLTLGEFWLEKRAVQHIDASTRIGASEYANRDGKGQPKDIDFSDPIHHCLGFNTLILRLWKVFLV